jgi:ABC-2 type transport system permease protein
MAFVALARKGWRIRTRQGFFAQTTAIAGLVYVLPPLLNVRALAGPDESQIARFESLAGTPNYLAFATIGVAAPLWARIAIGDIAKAFRDERIMGTVGAMWASPTPRPLLIAGDALGRMAANVIFGIIVFAGLWAIYRFPLTPEPFAAATVLVTGVIAGLALGIGAAAFVVKYREAGVVISLIVMGAAILAGVVYPTTVLPGWAQALGMASPLTWMVAGLRDALVYGTANSAYRAALILGVMAAAYGALGGYLFRRLARSAQRRGLLEAF